MSQHSSTWPPIELPPEFTRKLEAFAPVLDKGAELFEAAKHLIWEAKLGEKICDDLYKRVVYLIFARSFCTFQSIQILLRCGFGADAASLLANLMENLIDLKYIARSPEDRSGQYADFEVVEKHELAKRFATSSNAQTAKAAGAVRDKLYKEHSTLVDSIDYRKAWSQKTIRERAREVGFLGEYDTLYARLCAFKHTTPFGIAGVIEVEGGATAITVGPSTIGIFWYSWITSNCFALILREVSLAFQLAIQQSFEAYYEQLRKICVDFRNQNPGLVRGV